MGGLDAVAWVHRIQATQYGQILSWMWYTISFFLLQSAVLAIQGSRTCNSCNMGTRDLPDMYA